MAQVNGNEILRTVTQADVTAARSHIRTVILDNARELKTGSAATKDKARKETLGRVSDECINKLLHQHQAFSPRHSGT